jgi:DNA-3-methyladenine glycosylase
LYQKDYNVKAMRGQLPLPQKFYSRNTILVAKELLGKVLVKDDMKGVIVETEAYIGLKDKASHASYRRKETCLPMWGSPGFSYVYLTYGIHYMFNISTEKDSFPAAVLIRAVEPLEGIKLQTNGPGKLTKALNITKVHNNIDITTGKDIYITNKNSIEKVDIVETTRIGVDYAGEYKNKPWRFYIKDNNYVSKK